MYKRQVLQRLESTPSSPARLDDLPLFAERAPPVVVQVSKVEQALRGLEPDTLSPREALEALYRLRSLLTDT